MLKGNNIEDIISQLRELLRPLQLEIEKNFSPNKYPFTFIIGNPRSGTTLLLQSLARINSFAVPSNLIARFSYAPYIGALIQQLLNDSLSQNAFQKELSSNLGKTKELLEPNEFQHFFRLYSNNFFPSYINQNQLEKIDFKSMMLGLSSIESVFDKPVLTKLVMFQYNLLTFFEQIPNSIFLYIKRDPIFIMQSIFQARLNYYGNLNEWWSVKPKEFDQLKNQDIYSQIAGQVYYTDKAISEQLTNIPDDNKLVLFYEDFIKNSEDVFEVVRKKYLKLGIDLQFDTYQKLELNSSNRVKIRQTDLEQLETAYLKLIHGS